jgi:hypothetical protein
VDDGALFGWQFRQRGGEFSTEGLGVGIIYRRERRKRFRIGAELLVLLVAGAAAAHEVNGRVVGQSNEERPFIPRSTQQLRLARQFDEHLLQHVARVLLVAGEIQKEGEQRLGVFVIPPLEFGSGGHCFHLHDAPGGGFCLAELPRAAPNAERYLIDVWRGEQGLPQSTVTGIGQTPDGFLWISTLDGLSRSFGTFHPLEAGCPPW